MLLVFEISKVWFWRMIEEKMRKDVKKIRIDVICVIYNIVVMTE